MAGEMATLLKPYAETKQLQPGQLASRDRGPRAGTAVGGNARKSWAAKKNQENMLAGVHLLRCNKLNVVLLDEDHRDAFLKYNKIAKALLTGEEARVRLAE